jgi:hypothetical protein
MISLLTSPLAVSRGGRAADNLAKVTETHGSVVTIGPRATSGMSESSLQINRLICVEMGSKIGLILQ